MPQCNLVNTELSRLLINCIVMLDIPTVLAEVMRLIAFLQIAGPAHHTLGPYAERALTSL